MRETGPVRKQIDLDADPEAAAPYIGPARTLLGVLKNQMKFMGLKQGWRTLLLPDGAAITARSMFGHDSIAISVPITAQSSGESFTPPETETTQPTFSFDIPEEKIDNFAGLRVCGYCGDIAWVWSPADAKPVALPALKGCNASTANAISADGGTVVGYCLDTISGAQYPVRWRHGAQGWAAAAIGAADGAMAAWSVSKDGSVIVGQGFTAFTTAPNPFDDPATNPAGQWVRAGAQGALARLNGSYQESSEPGAVVSPNGKWVAGKVLRTGEYVYDYSTPVLPRVTVVPLYKFRNYGTLALWNRVGDTFGGPTIAEDGLSFSYASWDYDRPGMPLKDYAEMTITFPAALNFVAMGVADDGTVVGWRDSENTGFIYKGGFQWLNPPVMRSGPLDAATSTPVVPSCITADATRIGGWTLNPDTDVFTAWVRTKGAQRVLGTGKVNAITVMDGKIAVGWDTARDAIVWDLGKNTRRVIPSLGGVMVATGAGRAKPLQSFDVATGMPVFEP